MADRNNYNREWSRAKRAKYSPGKIQCLMCKGWYIQLGSHVRQRHNMSALEYKQKFDLPTSRGIIPRWYREVKGEIALENGTYKNLESGASTRYKKGDPRAIRVDGWKGRKGNKGFQGY